MFITQRTQNYYDHRYYIFIQKKWKSKSLMDVLNSMINRCLRKTIISGDSQSNYISNCV